MKPMTNVYYSKLFALINIVYRKIFHEEISSEVEKFIKNLSYVGIGTIIASIFSFSYNILAGRWLGPSEYGTFTLVQSVAMFLYIPMLLGFHTAMVKYNAEKVDFIRQRSIISTTYILVFLFTVASLLVYFVFSKDIIAIFSISSEVFYFALLFAVLFVFYTLTVETLRSLHMIRTYSRLMPVHSAILFFTFLFFALICKDLSFKSPLISMLLAYGIMGGVILAILKNYLRPQFNKNWVGKLSHYSIYSLLGGISYVLYSNIDKLMINYYLTISEVGIYRAYYYSFTTVLLLISTIFVTTFFPFASSRSDKSALFSKVNKVSIAFIGMSFPVALISGSIILSIYGSGYHLDLTLMVLFALLAIVIPVNQFYDWLMCSVGVEGVKLVSYAALSTAIANIVLNITLIPILGITGAVISTIMSYVISTMILLSKRKLLTDQKITTS